MAIIINMKISNKEIFLGALGILVLIGVLTFSNSNVAVGKFNQYGYNYTARIFNGLASGWCEAKGLPSNCMGDYSNDRLVMKWTADWDRGNAENWATPPYSDAWTDNEWNGKLPGGSGSVWHYKIKWIGPCGADYTPLSDGGYCIWGQFETLMDQGVDPNAGPGHLWFAKALPNGYGAP